MQDTDVKAKVENLMLEADRLALKLLAPVARKTVIILKSLYSGDKSEDEILADCIMFYPRCKSIKPALAYLEKIGVIEKKPWKGDKYSLTDFGRELANALFELLKDLRSVVEDALRGSVNVVDLYVQLVTPAMSVVEVALSSKTRRELLMHMTLHAYISTLTAAALSLLSKYDPRFTSILAELEKMFTASEEEKETEETGEQSA